MKRTISAGIVSLFIIFAAATVFAGNGYGPGGGQGIGTCTGTGSAGQAIAGSTLVCSGVVQTVTGTVVSYGMPGLVIDTGTSSEVFYGIGPVWYWDRNGIDRPEIGEEVTLETEAVTIGTTVRQVIVSVAVGDGTIVLRDSSTCLPLWRGQR